VNYVWLGKLFFRFIIRLVKMHKYVIHAELIGPIELNNHEKCSVSNNFLSAKISKQRRLKGSKQRASLHRQYNNFAGTKKIAHRLKLKK